MKKKQLSKLAIMGLATGIAMTGVADLSATAMTEKTGTHLAGGCSGGCGGNKNRPNPTNYTADTYTTPSNAPVNPNMAPKPDAMKNYNPNTANGQSCSANRPANGQAPQGKMNQPMNAPQGQMNGQPTQGAARPANYSQTQTGRASCSANPRQPSHSCSTQTAGCGANTGNGYRR